MTDISKTVNPPNAGGVKRIQQDFNIYQNLSFPKREARFFALELCGECGELANLEKKQWRDPAKIIEPQQFADEAADVFIALINYCNEKNIDLEAAVQQKLEKIEKRRLAGTMGPTS